MTLKGRIMKRDFLSRKTQRGAASTWVFAGFAVVGFAAVS